MSGSEGWEALEETEGGLTEEQVEELRHRSESHVTALIKNPDGRAILDRLIHMYLLERSPTNPLPGTTRAETALIMQAKRDVVLDLIQVILQTEDFINVRINKHG